MKGGGRLTRLTLWLCVFGLEAAVLYGVWRAFVAYSELYIKTLELVH